MANTGFKSPTSASSVSETPYDDITWANPTNIYASDDTDARVTSALWGIPQYTYVLKAQGFDFSSIPSGATITGVVVRVEAASLSGIDAVFVVAQLLDTSSARVGSNLASDQWYPPTTDTTHDWGGSTNTWGNSLTDTWVKNSNFGVGLVVQADDGAGNCRIWIDHIQIDVYYSTSGALPQIHDGTGWKTVTEVSIHDGTGWKTVTSIQIHDGTGWKSLV